jgi:hypothetical protein
LLKSPREAPIAVADQPLDNAEGEDRGREREDLRRVCFPAIEADDFSADRKQRLSSRSGGSGPRCPRDRRSPEAISLTAKFQTVTTAGFGPSDRIWVATGNTRPGVSNRVEAVTEKAGIVDSRQRTTRGPRNK